RLAKARGRGRRCDAKATAGRDPRPARPVAPCAAPEKRLFRRRRRSGTGDNRKKGTSMTRHRTAGPAAFGAAAIIALAAFATPTLAQDRGIGVGPIAVSGSVDL